MSHLRKHLRAWWNVRFWGMPKWREDRIAHMLGIGTYGCPLCGFGAIAERDRAEAGDRA